MVIGLVASLPVMAAGLVALTGIAGLQTDPRLARAALVEPSFALPLAAVWGAVGGQIGRRVSDIRGRFARRHAQARGA
jgi:hypothetical protein